MTAEELIYTVLVPLVDGRVFPDVAPEGTPVPYITYQAVGGEPLNFLTGEKPSATNARMQINVWSKLRVEASQIGAFAEDALRAATALQVEILTGRIATYDEVTKYRGTMQDVSLWY